jgi:hypothetical protein
MKNTLLLLVSAIIISLSVNAQIDKMKDILDDEMDTENFTVRFFNALTGEPISGGKVVISDIGEFTTDMEGKIKFPRTEEDRILMLRFSAAGYIPSDIKVEIIAGTVFYNRISISPEMAMENFRVILDWGRTPRDLDAHFIKEDAYHISYRNMKSTDDGIARLDRDDTNGWGPETITVKKIETDAEYSFHVHDFTNRLDDNSKKLSRSGAVVKVYFNNSLMHQCTVPKDVRGNIWEVFMIRDGVISSTHCIKSED